MKKILILTIATLIPQFSYAESSAMTSLKSSSAEAMSCVKGFATASQILGQPQYQDPNNQIALSLAKTTCTSDELVIVFYNAQRNTKDAKSLEEIRDYAQEMVGTWFTENAAMLQAAGKKYNQ